MSTAAEKQAVIEQILTNIPKAYAADLRSFEQAIKTTIKQVMQARIESIPDEEGRTSVERSFMELIKIVNLTEAIHGEIVITAIMTLYEADKDSDLGLFDADWVRKFTERCVSDFQFNLQANIGMAFEKVGDPNPFHPNADITADILKGIEVSED